MFSFFEAIFSTVTSVVTSIFVAVGLVSSPVVHVVPEQSAAVAQPFVDEGAEDTGTAEEEASEDDILLSEIEKLRAEVAALKAPKPKPAPVKVTPPPAPPPAPSVPSVPIAPSAPSQPTAPKTLTLPSGVVVELDADGKIVQDQAQSSGTTQQSTGSKTVKLPSGITVEVDSASGLVKDYANANVVRLPNGSLVELGADGQIVRYIDESGSTSQTDGLQITDVDISAGIDSAVFRWETTKSLKSKVSISGDNFSSKDFTTSLSSTRHTVNVSGLDEDTEYSYTIEADDGTTVVEETGKFSTKALSVRGIPYVYTLGSTGELHLYFETYQSRDMTVTVKFKDAGSTVTGEFSTSGKVHTARLGSEIETEVQRLLDEDKNSSVVAAIKFDTSKGTEQEFTLRTDNPAIKY